MTISMQRVRILGTCFSLMNIIFTAFFIPLWLEYAEAILGGKMNRLSGNNVPLDVVMVAVTCLALILSIRQLVKIGKGQAASLRTPVAVFVLYCAVILISLL